MKVFAVVGGAVILTAVVALATVALLMARAIVSLAEELFGE